MVTRENYEEYLVLLADGELDAEGQKELEAFMQLHPEVREELALYEKLHLSPDTNQVFSGKEDLLKPEPKGRTISLGNWRQFSAAAAILLLIALGFMMWRGGDTEPALTENKSETPFIKPVSPPDTGTAVAREEPKEEETVKPSAYRPQKQQLPVIAKEENDKIPVSIPGTIEITNKPKVERKIAQTSGSDLPALPEIKEPAPEQREPEMLAWLPVSNEKKEGLNLIGEAVSDRFEKVKEIRNNLKNTDLAVRLGNRELFTVRF
jgi:hypothetical protein